MATYYVRPDGNNANAGTGPATNQAWQTLTKALGATGIASGDTVYIAPGSYNESVTIGMTSATATTSVIGDPTASQFTGVTAGPVLWTVYTSAGASPTLTSIIATSKNYLSFQNIIFDGGTVQFTTSTNTSFINCQFTNTSIGTSSNMLVLTSPTSTALAATINRCSFIGGYYAIRLTGGNVADTTSVTNCLFLAHTGGGIGQTNCQITYFNNSFLFCENGGIDNAGGNASFKSNASNCLFYNGGYAIYSDTSNVFTQTYNRFIANTANVNNVPTSGTTTTTFSHGLILPYYLQNSLGTFQMFSSIFGGPNTSAGIATSAPASDMYGVTWTGTSPDTGSATYRNLSNVTPYVPTERNASTITIAPGSTSQTIELYLGATGLTASTAGLSARYNRTRTASVSIPLVARTIDEGAPASAGVWISGGFAEVDSTNMPGVYRLDIPNTAIAAGADDVTVVVRGASGTNGAVMTVKLSSGGLTGAQTAAAVWDADPTGYNTATNFGGVMMETNNLANGIESTVLDIPQSVWDAPKSSHTIANTFGDYLDTKVSTGADTARIQLRQGPFLIKQNAIDSVITEVNQFLSTVPNIEMVLIDSSGGSVSVAGATLVMRVRNQAGTAVVNNITPTVAYADGGVIRWSPNLSWNALTVTTAGTYRIVVERTMSGVTTTFGPFLVQLSSG